MATKKKAKGIPTIDVCMVIIKTTELEIAIETAKKVAVEVQTETTDAIKLVKNGKLIAQKGKKVTVTGNQITLTDNVFIPEVAKILQGGKIEDTEGTGYPKYTPPKAGSGEEGEVFELVLYSAVYDASGQIVKYEQTTYPNCKGTPFGMTREDDTFSSPELVIDSAPKNGQAPYTIEYVDQLPTDYVETQREANGLSVI